MSGGAARLERGEIVELPGRGFVLAPDELAYVTGPLALGRAKSVSFDPATGCLRGVGRGGDTRLLARLLGRYAAFARALTAEVAPEYGHALVPRRASLRARPAESPALSGRKDDRRLHADAFPSSPTGGDRILRVFTNFDPQGQSRLWRIGEPFAAYASRWLPRARRPWPGEGWVLQRLGLTRGRRTHYDALMLGLHDAAKADVAYQSHAPSREIAFAAGNSWIVYTDEVVHAALAGRFALEQTFSLPVAAMVDPERSPLRILERLSGRVLA